MAGIPVHTSSPVNPNPPPNPFGASPSTYAARYTPAEASPTSPPPPQSGAPAVAAPTTLLRDTDSPSPKTLPAAITRASLRPTSYQSPPSLHRLHIPNGTAYSSPYTAPPRQHHRHTSLQTPLRHQPPQSASTNTHFHTPPTPYSSTTPISTDLSHPPGYVQSRGSFDDRPLSACSDSSPNIKAYYTNKSRLSILDGHYEVENQGDEDPLSASSKWIWDTAVKWTKVAGTKLKEGEEGLWKRVNGDV